MSMDPKVGSMIPVDLSAHCEGWMYDPNGSGIQILGIRSRDPFSGSTACLLRSQCARRTLQVIVVLITPPPHTHTHLNTPRVV